MCWSPAVSFVNDRVRMMMGGGGGGEEKEHTILIVMLKVQSQYYSIHSM